MPFVKADLPAAIPVVSKRMVIIGSSVAAGMGASNYVHSWAGRLTEALRSRGWEIINRSIPGDTTTGVRNRLQHDALTLKPSIVIVALGFYNDGLTISSDHGAIFSRATQNLLAMAAQIRAAGAMPVLGGVYPNNSWGDNEKRYLLKFYQWADNHQLPTLDFLTLTEDGHGRWKEGFYADHTHPNDNGSEAMFKGIPVDLFDELLSQTYALRKSQQPADSKQSK